MDRDTEIIQILQFTKDAVTPVLQKIVLSLQGLMKAEDSLVPLVFTYCLREVFPDALYHQRCNSCNIRADISSPRPLTDYGRGQRWVSAFTVQLLLREFHLRMKLAK